MQPIDPFDDEIFAHLSELTDVPYDEVRQRPVAECERELIARAVRGVALTFEAALATKLVLHRDHGLGFPKLAPSPETGELSVVVWFRDGERVFGDGEAAWPDPRKEWAAAALRDLRVDAAPEDEFWELVAALDWERASEVEPLDFTALGAAVRARVSVTGCAAMQRSMYRLASRLRDAIEAWEKQSGKQLEGGDDSVGDLIKHVVGCGRVIYDATCANPELAFERAEAGRYTECFAYVFQHAEKLYPVEQIEAALRERGLVPPPRPRYGVE